MADTIFGSGCDQWVCPNDRQLALRAKLHTGWSVHTYQTEKQRKSQSLSPAEVEAILQVIQRAERLDILEQQRVGRLVERLETMRRNVMGNGLSQCLLCGEVLGFLGSSSVFCKDCRKVWKRSGAWFYKGIPKFILPLKIPGQADHPSFRPLPVEPAEQEPRSTETSRVYTWARGRVVSSDSDSDSDLSSSSLDDRLRPAGVRDPKGNKPWGESGGSVESLKMGPTRPASCLSGSQSSLASETGTGSADPRGAPAPWLDPEGPGEYQATFQPAHLLPVCPPPLWAAPLHVACLVLTCAPTLESARGCFQFPPFTERCARCWGNPGEPDPSLPTMNPDLKADHLCLFSAVISILSFIKCNLSKYFTVPVRVTGTPL
uniref:Rabphilin 3A like (without C2 domains) n=1 Tax=Bos indicus x Bos taurus TaxID=30522 RepID=A0A4W2DRQ1_BOBOX